jgi:uncharacterized BrkB/YihY/UPF0761 family membrane protein
MIIKERSVNWFLGRLFSFLGRVVRGFMRNKGLLLSGSLAYYTLLSIVPMSILLLTVLSHFIEEEQLLHTLSTYTGMVIPGYTAILAEQVQVFLEHRQTVGIIGFLAMIFFSAMAFGVLQSALSVIVPLGEWEKNPRLQAKTLVCLRHGALQEVQPHRLRYQVSPGLDHEIPQAGFARARGRAGA